MDFQTAIKAVKTATDEGLQRFFTQKRQEAKHINPHCLPLVDQVESLTTRGGKKTRAFLCWLGYVAIEQRTRNSELGILNPELLSAMMALELFQSFALIHDDIIDEDSVRRGGPTVHEHFRGACFLSHVPSHKARRFGESMAILAGDLALVWADELMLTVKDSLVVYQKMKEEAIYGQTLDVMEEYMKPGIPKELIDTYKTAWYSVIRPLQIGACIAGADRTFLDDLASFGLIAGRAYQLRDDALDSEVSQADFEETAKKYERDMHRVIASWRLGETQKQLFIDFFHFALTRPL